jgi:hypothetical protein
MLFTNVAKSWQWCSSEVNASVAARRDGLVRNSNDRKAVMYCVMLGASSHHFSLGVLSTSAVNVSYLLRHLAWLGFSHASSDMASASAVLLFASSNYLISVSRRSLSPSLRFWRGGGSRDRILRSADIWCVHRDSGTRLGVAFVGGLEYGLVAAGAIWDGVVQEGWRC